MTHIPEKTGKRRRGKTTAAVLLLLASMALETHAKPPTLENSESPAIPKKTTAEKGKEKGENVELIWMDSLSEAMKKASGEYRPILIFLYSPTCSWCAKTRSQTLNDPRLAPLLAKFVLLEINVARNKNAAATFQVMSVPTIVLSKSNGEQIKRLEGFADVKRLEKALSDTLGDGGSKNETSLTRLLNEMEAASIKSDGWKEVALAFGRFPYAKKTLMEAVREYKGIPKDKIVEILSDKRLTARLGAMEILEEMAGSTLGFDPWRPPDSPENEKSLKRWRKWAGVENKNDKIYTPFTIERCATLIANMLSKNPERAARAARTLENGGKTSIAAINAFLEKHPDIHKNKKNEILKLKYMIIIPKASGIDPARVAKKIAMGKLDAKMDAIAKLKTAGQQVLPILQDCLENPNPMVRDAAAESILAIKTPNVVEILAKHIAYEKDNDIVFTIIKGLGEFKTKKAFETIAHYLGNEDEDVKVAALSSIAMQSSNSEFMKNDKKAEKKVLDSLNDPRWRVRTAALNTVAKLNLKAKAIVAEVGTLIADKDEFVRYKAVGTLATIAPDQALRIFPQVFEQNDSLKGAIIEAYGKMDVTVPGKIVDALEKVDDDTLVLAVQGMDKCGKEALPVAFLLARKKNPDAKIPALKFIAENACSTAPSHANAVLAEALVKGDDKEKLAILRHLRTPESFTGQLKNLKRGTERNTPATTRKSRGGKPKEIQTLINAFEDDKEGNGKKETVTRTDEKEKTPPLKTRNSNKSINKLFDAFGVDAHDENQTKGENGSASMKQLARVIEKIFNSSKSDEIKLHAAAIMTIGGHSGSADFLSRKLHAKPESTKLKILHPLYYARKKSEASIDVAMALTEDTSENVRSIASRIIMESEKIDKIIELFKKASLENSRLKPHEIYDDWRIRSLMSTPAKLLEWAADTLKSKKSNTESITTAILFIDKAYDDKYDDTLENFTKSKNPIIRRAAYHALMRNSSKNALIKRLIPKITTDPDDLVKEALTHAALSKAGEYDTWLHYFDEKHNDRIGFNNMGRSIMFGTTPTPSLSTEFEKALRDLLGKNNSPAVRVGASFALLWNKKPIDLTRFVKLLSSLPDQERVKENTTTFFNANYRILGQPFTILLPFLKHERYNVENIKNIYAHFNIDMNSNTQTTKNIVLKTNAEDGKQQAVFIENKNASTDKPRDIAPERPLIVFFHKPGCKDCEKVEKNLEALKNIFPKLRIEKHDISKIDAMRLNEAYCEKFGIPTRSRLVAPAVFAGKGGLVKNDISKTSLEKLVASSIDTPPGKWRVKGKMECAKADERIKRSFEKKTNVWIVALAGLLDGINPCAFATIIFLVSYLTVAKRTQKEIAFVGTSFVAAVFISYMAFGLGLNAIIGEFYVLKIFRTWFDRILVASIVVIMALSFYDGILCMKGKMEKMTLQLPGFLKDRIRASIRGSARKSRFVLAAFAAGCVVSFLELACTGQVYLPTIGYMWRSGSDHVTAAALLVVYNSMFITPLMAVFATAYYGLKSDSLTKFMRKHAAFVKFATAALFLAFLILMLKMR
jgi:cytochrome c biogenesis protein CcdA/HEAT repeat protein/thioredoxin-related protein